MKQKNRDNSRLVPIQAAVPPPGAALGNGEELGSAQSGTLSNAGATVKPLYTERQCTMWALSATELMSLSLLGHLAAACFSASAFCAGIAVNIIISLGGSRAPLSETGVRLLNPGCWVFAVGAAVFSALAICAHVVKGTVLGQIKKESRSVTVAG